MSALDLYLVEIFRPRIAYCLLERLTQRVIEGNIPNACSSVSNWFASQFRLIAKKATPSPAASSPSPDSNVFRKIGQFWRQKSLKAKSANNAKPKEPAVRAPKRAGSGSDGEEQARLQISANAVRR